jgi:hypothetical protein
MFRFFLVAALPRWDLRSLRGEMVFVHLLSGMAAKFAQAAKTLKHSSAESILSLLVEGFEMTDLLACHFERIARNLS